MCISLFCRFIYLAIIKWSYLGPVRFCVYLGRQASVSELWLFLSLFLYWAILECYNVSFVSFFWVALIFPIHILVAPRKKYRLFWGSLDYFFECGRPPMAILDVTTPTSLCESTWFLLFVFTRFRFLSLSRSLSLFVIDQTERRYCCSRFIRFETLVQEPTAHLFVVSNCNFHCNFKEIVAIFILSATEQVASPLVGDRVLVGRLSQRKGQIASGRWND